MCDIKMFKMLCIYFIHDIKDYIKSRHDYMFSMIRVEKQTYKITNELIKYFMFNPKTRKTKIIEMLIELQESMIDIRNDDISR